MKQLVAGRVLRIPLLISLGLFVFGTMVPTVGIAGAYFPNADTRPVGQQKAREPDKSKQKESADQTLKIKTQLLEIRTVVTDKQGHSLAGLTKEDFEVLEDGKPQPVEFFNAESAARMGRGDATPDSVNGGKPPVDSLPGAGALHREPPRRIVAIFVDNLNMQATSLLPAKQALRRFIRERLNDQDLACVLPSGGTSGLLGQFTQNRELLALAVDRLRVVTPVATSSFTPYLASQIERNDRDALSLGIGLARSEDKIAGSDSILEAYVRGKASTILAQAENDTRISLFTLKALVDRMAALPGQKTIALLSDGFTLQTSGGVMDTAAVQAVTARAVKAGVVIYSIDAAGLRGPPGFSAALGNQPARMGGLLSRYASAAEDDARQGMGAIALDTGGEEIRNTNDILGSVERALDENVNYYLLAYYPADSNNPNRFRKITIRVKGHPEYHLRSLKGYIPGELAREFEKEEKAEANLTPQQKLVRALMAPLSAGEIRVEADATYFERQGQPQSAHVKAFISAENLEFKPGEQGEHFKLQVLTIVFDTAGKAVDNNDEIVEGNIRPDQVENLRRDGLIQERHLALKPGAYQVRIGVREVETGKMGTATAWIQVPDLSRKKLAISSLFVGNEAEVINSPVPSKDDARKRTIYRDGVKFFGKSDALVYYFKVYNSDLAAPKPAGLQMKLEILQGGALVLGGPWSDATAHKVSQDEMGADLGGAFSLASLKAGVYELKLSLKEPKSKEASVESTILFGIEK